LQLVIVEDEVGRITGELAETKRLLAERDSQLKDLGSEVNQLQSKLKQSEVRKRLEINYCQIPISSTIF